MATLLTVFICLLFAVIHLVLLTQAANVALWKRVEANKTCGSPAEEYYNVAQRQLSPRDRRPLICNALIPSESHNATKLVDGNFSSWWQSSASVDKAFITIDLGRSKKVRNITITLIQLNHFLFAATLQNFTISARTFEITTLLKLAFEHENLGQASAFTVTVHKYVIVRVFRYYNNFVAK